MNVSVVIIFLLPMVLDVVYGDKIIPDVSSVLEFFPEMKKIKEDIRNLRGVIVNLFGKEIYTLTLEQARLLCEEYGTRLATMNDMLEAFRWGVQNCACGWIADGQAYKILQKPTLGCGFGVGILKCNKWTKWNAWCKIPQAIPVINEDKASDFKQTPHVTRTQHHDNNFRLSKSSVCSSLNEG